MQPDTFGCPHYVLTRRKSPANPEIVSQLEGVGGDPIVAGDGSKRYKTRIDSLADGLWALGRLAAPRPISA
jgi:hypothetical protein